ncbi:MAG: hypothetical protein R3E95_18760 [Thiolinea sp.]
MAQNNQLEISYSPELPEPGLESVGYPPVVHALEGTANAVRRIADEGLTTESALSATGMIASGVIKSPKIVKKQTNHVSNAEDRAKQIHNALPKVTQDKTTISVTETKEGINIVSSSEMRLRPVQRKLLNENEVAAKGKGHAEVTGVNTIKEMGLTPTGTAASRPICDECKDFLKKEGVEPLSPLKNQD